MKFSTTRSKAAKSTTSWSAFEATRRLLALGHRRIAFLRRVNLGMRRIDPDSAERQAGFEAALKQAGLSAEGLVFNVLPHDPARFSAFETVFDPRSGVTALLAVDGTLARLAARAAHQRGLTFPRDLSLVCFQALTEDFPECSGPRFDFQQFGAKAVDLLNAQAHPPQTVRIPAIWAEARTVGPARNR